MSSNAEGRGQRKRIGKLEDKITKITKSEEQKEKNEKKRNRGSGFSGNVTRDLTLVFPKFQKERRKRVELKKVFKELMSKNF